jgi:hypothetical protein
MAVFDLRVLTEMQSNCAVLPLCAARVAFKIEVNSARVLERPNRLRNLATWLGRYSSAPSRTGSVCCGAEALACLVLVNFAAASPRGKIEVADL